jgi:hypothetical protein
VARRATRSRRASVTVAALAVLAWLGLTIAFVASKTQLLTPEEFTVAAALVGLVTGIAIGRWGAVLLPLTLLPPTLVFDVVRRALATGAERYDPRPPLTLYLVIVFVLPTCLAVAGGVALRKLSEARRA